MIINEKRLGQMKSIDKAYSEVDTEYIFHCEDDWKFFKNGFIEKSMKLLEEDEEQGYFLTALLNSLPHFCTEKVGLQIPIPVDPRLLPVCSYINKNYMEQVSIDDLADLSLMSVRSLQRIFKRETGITIQKYMQLIRILKSIELINTGEYTLSQIAFMIGYKSLSAFTNSYFGIMKEKAKIIGRS